MKKRRNMMKVTALGVISLLPLLFLNSVAFAQDIQSDNPVKPEESTLIFIPAISASQITETEGRIGEDYDLSIYAQTTDGNQGEDNNAGDKPEFMVKEQQAINLLEKSDVNSASTNAVSAASSTRAAYVVGHPELHHWYWIEIPFPSYLRDFDGGTIRLVMQHERSNSDEVRVIDLHVGTEFDNDAYGRRGRHMGRSGWTRQSGGGEHRWILGDTKREVLANPWNWVRIVDYSWLFPGELPLGIDRIRIYTHPHVTTRVMLKD